MRDVTLDRFVVSIITTDGAKHEVPYDSLTWEATADEIGLRVRFTAPQLAGADWDPAYCGEGSYWILDCIPTGGDPTNPYEIARGRIMAHDQPLASDSPLNVTANDLLYQFLKSRIHVYYEDQPGADILTDLCTQFQVPIDNIQGPTINVGRMYGTRPVTIADVIKKVFERARAKGDQEWVLRWTSKGLSVVRPGTNATVYWFIEQESVLTGTMTSSIEDMVTRVLALRQSGGDSQTNLLDTLDGGVAQKQTSANSPATVIGHVDGHVEMGVFQDIVSAKKDDTDADALQAAQAILDLAGQPKITLRMTVPLVPEIQRGDSHRVTAGPIDGYMFVEGYSAAEASRTMQIDFAAKYVDLFTVQAASGGVQLDQPDPNADDPTASALDSLMSSTGGGNQSGKGAGLPDIPKQQAGYSCSAASSSWLMRCYGKQLQETDVVNMLGLTTYCSDGGGNISTHDGLCDGSGAYLALKLHQNTNLNVVSKASVSFDDVVALLQHGPIAMGGHGWVHWTGVKSYDANTDSLVLANPAPGWIGIQQTMSRAQFNASANGHMTYGPFSAVYVNS